MRNVLRYVAWPIMIAGFVGTYFSIANIGEEFESRNGLLVLALVLVFVPCTIILERIIPYQPSWNRLGRQELNDVGHLLLTGMGTDGGRLMALVALPLVINALPWRPVGIWPQDLPVIAQVPMAILVYTSVYYWNHRLAHHWKPLWRIHRLHHTPDHMGATKGFRAHGIEYLIEAIWLTIIFGLLGTPPVVLQNMGGAMLPFGILAHSNVNNWTPKTLDFLFTTPRNHRIHHDTGIGQYHNYGAITLIWDVLFRTYKHPDDLQVTEVGLENDKASPTMLGQVFDFVRTY